MSNTITLDENQIESVTPRSEDQLVEALDAAKNVAQVNNPEDMAAAFFSLSEPRFDALSNDMTSRQLRRVFKKAILFPFGKKDVKLLSKQEEDLTYLLSEMIMHKMIMQLHYETKKVQEAQERQEAALAAQQNTETNQGENNESTSTVPQV